VTSELRPFHLALPVTDLGAADDFYCGVLGCNKGRSASRWIDLNFFGHQVTLHLVDAEDTDAASNSVDGESVPARHFGMVLEMDDWRSLAARLEQDNSEFLISPQIRFAGEIGEQATLFIRDPSGNALEFKSFADSTQLFAT
jgi:extradiol dioxygenase family protein